MNQFNDKFFIAKLALLNILKTANNGVRPGGGLSMEGLFAQDALEQIQKLEMLETSKQETKNEQK